MGNAKTMNSDNRSSCSLPLSTILFFLVMLAVILWGFSALLYVAGLFIGVTVLAVVSGKIWHSRGRPECQLAKKSVESEHNDWQVGPE